MSASETQEKIRALARRDGTYRPEAYTFTLEALNYTLEEMRKTGHEGHIDGKQLLHGMRDYGRRMFGYLGAVVFNEWGIVSTADFGEIVFRLVDADLLSKQDSDQKEDFANVFDIEGAFEAEFIHP